MRDLICLLHELATGTPWRIYKRHRAMYFGRFAAARYALRVWLPYFH